MMKYDRIDTFFAVGKLFLLIIATFLIPLIPTALTWLYVSPVGLAQLIIMGGVCCVIYLAFFIGMIVVDIILLS